jgi:hypothetical protein
LRAAAPATIPIVRGPGLAKARRLPVLVARETVLVRACSPRWNDLFENADIVTEGSAREEPHGRVWYGMTSMILSADGADAALLAAVAARDVHVRLHAVRVARREACLRAPGRLGRLGCEIQVKPDARGVRIDVDMQAPLIEWSARSRLAR